MSIFNFKLKRSGFDYLLVCAIAVHLVGLYFFVVRPLYSDSLTQEHFTTFHDSGDELKPASFQVGHEQPRFSRTLSFQTETLMDLSNIASVRFMLATYNRTVDVRSVSLRFGDGNCIYADQNASKIHDNTMIRLGKVQCDQANIPVGTIVFLEIETVEPDQSLAIWVSPKPSPNDKLLLRIQAEAFQYPVGGFGVNVTPLKNRFEIIDAIWGISWISLVLKAILLILAASPFLFLIRLSGLTRCVGIVFISTISYSVLYTLIIPPLQAPDEADHFISYAHLIGKPGLADEILIRMNKSHYERVFCHDSEKVDSFSVLNPMNASWPAHAPILNVSERSWMGAALWRFYDSILKMTSASEILVMTRTFNAIIIALVLSLISLAIGFQKSESAGFLPVLSTASIPPFWFFATHLSNHTLIITGYLAIFAISMSLLTHRTFSLPSFLVALPLLLISLLSGRAAMPSLFAMCLILSIGIVFEKDHWKRYLLALFALLASAIALFFEFEGTLYLQGIMVQVKMFSGKYWPYLIFAVGFTIVGLLLTRRIIQAILKFLHEKALAVRILGGFCILMFLVLMVLPLFKVYHLENIEFMEKPSLLVYLKKTLLVLITNLGMRGDDFLVIRTLWGGFGCPDNFFSQHIIELLKGFMFLGWILAIADSLGKNDIKALLRSMAVLAAAGLYFVLLAFLCWSMSATVVGRYNVGFLLVLLSVSSFGWYCLIVSISKRLGISERALAGICFIALSVITFASLNQVLLRYYV